ncbi:MAG: DUF348 domain-containing protein [Anaerolineae bacterium]|nr:DUF348 domain-containing protein [Anaerolineae bacterium]
MTKTLPTSPRSLRPGTRFWVVVFLLVVALSIAIPLIVDRLTRTAVTLDVSGSVRRLHTRAHTVQEVLDEADVLIDPEDVIRPEPAIRVQEGMTITVRKAFAVAVEADGEVRHVRTQAAQPLDILAEQAIRVGLYDVIRVNGRDFSLEHLDRMRWDRPPSSIQVVRSAALRVIDGERTLVIHTTQADVGRALDTAGLKFYLADGVIPDLSTPVRDGLTVRIVRSVPVTVIADGRQLVTRARGPTVGDALVSAGIAPAGQDYSIPPMDTPLEPEMAIQLVRVSETLLIEQEPIPFTTIYRPDTSLVLDDQRVIQEGAPGVRERHIRVRSEDGLEVSRVVQGEWIERAPTPRLIGYGTRIETRRFDSPDGPVDYWRKLRVRVTSYSPTRSGVDPDSPMYGLTSLGLALARGVVAVDPAVIPLSGEIYVPGYGRAVAGDARPDVQGCAVALGYEDDEWQSWSGWVDVYLVAPVPPGAEIAYLLPPAN